MEECRVGRTWSQAATLQVGVPRVVSRERRYGLKMHVSISVSDDRWHLQQPRPPRVRCRNETVQATHGARLR
jgi:hypothetical protein